MAKRGNNEGSVYRRRDGLWVAAITEAGGGRRKFYAHSRQEAARKLREALSARDKGLPQPGRTSIAAFLERWLEDTAARKVRPRTLRRYQEIVRLHLVPSLGR